MLWKRRKDNSRWGEPSIDCTKYVVLVVAEVIMTMVDASWALGNRHGV